jgi:AcrR family transcriptional regulator
MDNAISKIHNPGISDGETVDTSSVRIPGQRDPDRTRRAILEAATEEFVGKGFAGASVNEIADRANVNKRMLYHYFGKKDELYIAVLERVYGSLRTAQAELQLSHLAPVEAIKKLVVVTWTYYLEHPEFLSLWISENMVHGRYAARSERLRGANTPLLTLVADVIQRGQKEQVFREDVAPFQLYLTIAALASHYVASRYTLSSLTGTDMTSKTHMDARLDHIIEVVLCFLRPVKTAD